MKNILYIVFLAVFFATVSTGCKDDDAPGLPAVEGLKAYSGKNRVRVEFTTPDRVDRFKVFYDNGSVLEQEVDPAAAQQSVIVDGLPEGEQVVRVVTWDGSGTVSSPKGVAVQVYGDIYQSQLLPRPLTGQEHLQEHSLRIDFGPAESTETGVFVVYFDPSAKKDSVWMESAKITVEIDDIDTEEPYYYYSVYKPGPESIDEFNSASVNARDIAMMELEKDKWTVAGVSSEISEGNAVSFIDDDAGTDWKSEDVPMPHWIAVDMQSEKKFDGFRLIQSLRMDEPAPAKFIRFEISSDNTEWTTVLEDELKAMPLPQTFAFDEQVTARYFKLTVLSGYGNVSYTQLAEINLYNAEGTTGNDPLAPSGLLANTKKPYSLANHFDDRYCQLAVWTHSDPSIRSYDNHPQMQIICLTDPHISNAKIYQTVRLEPGSYVFNIECGGMDFGTGVEGYNVVTTAGILPDYANVGTDPGVLGYKALATDSNNYVSFTLTAAADVTIGWVYNVFGGGSWSCLYVPNIEFFH